MEIAQEDQKKYKFILWLEFGAFLLTLLANVLFIVIAVDGKEDLGLAGIAAFLGIANAVPATIWRFFIWLSVKKRWSSFPMLLSIDFGLLFLPISGLVLSLAWPLSLLAYLRIPGDGIMHLILGAILAGTALIFAWQMKQGVNKKRISFIVMSIFIFIIGVFTWAYLSDRRQIDPDHDGLTTLEEARFKTSPTKADTDGDGLSDCVEKAFPKVAPPSLPLYVSRFGTDPLKSDTDGDGVLDRDEVTQKTNPIGPGVASQQQLAEWEEVPNIPWCGDTISY